MRTVHLLRRHNLYDTTWTVHQGFLVPTSLNCAPDASWRVAWDGPRAVALDVAITDQEHDCRTCKRVTQPSDPAFMYNFWTNSGAVACWNKRRPLEARSPTRPCN